MRGTGRELGRVKIRKGKKLGVWKGKRKLRVGEQKEREWFIEWGKNTGMKKERTDEVGSREKQRNDLKGEGKKEWRGEKKEESGKSN